MDQNYSLAAGIPEGGESDLYSLLQYMSPEMIQSMIDSGLVDDRMGLANQKMTMGRDMLNTPMAQGAQVGRTYVAASPLEHLANAVRMGVGGYMMGQGRNEASGLIDQRGQGRKSYITGLADAQQRMADDQAARALKRMQQSVPGAPDPINVADTTDYYGPGYR